MKQTFITRKDAGIGVGEFDSIAWSFSEHVKEPDTGEFNSAVMFGNEDSPVRIEFYVQETPKVTDVPAWVWVSPEHRA